MSNVLTNRYQTAIAQKNIVADPEQAFLIKRLEQLYQKLLEKIITPQASKHRRWWWRFKKRNTAKEPVKGLYIYGGVGIGKTYAVDLFYDALPTTRKLRLHFHSFMQQVHEDLKRLQGQKNPLRTVARHFSLQAHIICLDEFLVYDIADAMLLAGLVDELFARQVVLVATSNIAPDDLYKNGLQRLRFLPAIALLKQHCEILHLQSQQDYRLQNLARDGVYFTPLDDHAQEAMQRYFNMYAHHNETLNAQIEINQRTIQTIACAPNIVWFDFLVICKTPRSKNDYLEIAKRYRRVLISGVKPIASDQNDLIIYFIHLIDIFYDEHVELIISAEVPAERLYEKGPKHAEFQRTLSRLKEMQSLKYIKQCP